MSLTLFRFQLPDDLGMLSVLSGLSELRLMQCSFPEQSTLSGINSLTSLKKLELGEIDDSKRLDLKSTLVKGKLSALRYLRVEYPFGYRREAKSDAHEVSKSLPALRRWEDTFPFENMIPSFGCDHVFEDLSA